VAYHADLRRHGSFARHTVVPARALLAVPAHLTDEAAAAFPCPGLTAWQALAKLPPLGGEPVLINGAGSNVGRFAVCLSLAAGLRVFASASSDHHDWLRQRGVQAMVDYRAADWLEQLGKDRFQNQGSGSGLSLNLLIALQLPAEKTKQKATSARKHASISRVCSGKTACIFEQQKELSFAYRRRFETKTSIKRLGIRIKRMSQQGPDSRLFGNFECTKDCILQHAEADPHALISSINGESRQNNHRNWILTHAPSHAIRRLE
jgi:hypothetical protein